MSAKNLTNNIIQELKLPEIHLVLGGLPGQTDPDIFVPEADPLIAKRINNLEKCLIADNNVWQYGKQYTAWAPDVTSNYYVYNSENRIVYLCTDNKPNNRTDEEAGISTEIPSHVEPEIRIYDDGYSWIPLFMVDISQLNFLSDRDLPIPDLMGTKNYLSFGEKYSSLCGTGVTAFGCCCLYFKENSVDEISGEVYSAGDVTNETIFSDCFECQKLADALDREVLFLSGLTAGDITSSNTGENPLCPATKTIKTLQEQLESEKYTLSPGSSREYALYLLNNFANEKGIMSARIDLSGLTQSYYAYYNDPILSIRDKTGSGADIQIKTTLVTNTDIGLDSSVAQNQNIRLITGMEVLNSGSNYTEVVDFDITGTKAISFSLDNRVSLVNFPEEFYNDPTVFVPAKRIRIKTTINSDEIADNVTTSSITKLAVLVNPKFYGSDAPAVFPEGDSSFRNLQTIGFAATGPTFEIA
jgi:hypothetical protein